jgi:hypothetical protein
VRSSTFCFSGTDLVDLGVDGVYMRDCQFGEAAGFAVDGEIAERLWALSEELVGVEFVL